MTTKTLSAGLVIRSAGDEAEITITTPTTDLMGDTVDPMGMDVSRYLNGTCAVNFAHVHNTLPIGKTTALSKTARGIRARFRWLDSNPEARSVRDVFEEGVLAASIEFLPVDAAPNQRGGYHYAKSILTGWALTGNPANPECVRVLKSLGFTPADEDIDLDAIDFDAGEDLSEDQMVSALREGFREARQEWDAAHADEMGGLTTADVRGAVQDVMRDMITSEITITINRLRGRVD